MALLKIFFKDVSHDAIECKSIVRSALVIGCCGRYVRIPVCAVSLADQPPVQFIDSVCVDKLVPGRVLFAKREIKLPHRIGKFYKRKENKNECKSLQFCLHCGKEGTRLVQLSPCKN